MSNTTGGIAGSSSATKWEPTVVYLFGLLIAEWFAFMLLTKYL